MSQDTMREVLELGIRLVGPREPGGLRPVDARIVDRWASGPHAELMVVASVVESAQRGRTKRTLLVRRFVGRNGDMRLVVFTLNREDLQRLTHALDEALRG